MNLLLDRNMTNEANEYVNRHIGVEPDNAEFRNAVHLRLRDADDNAKAREFDKWRKADNEQHGAFASDYAEILFAKKDWNNFTRILNEARSRQDQRPFRGFTFDAGKTNSWISSIRSDKEITEADKVRVLISLRDLDIYNYSIYAKLALLQIESQKPKAEIERLKALRSALLRADNGAHGWNTALGFAQAALSAGDHVGAATLLTAAQAYAGNVPASYKQNGRGLLAQAYSRIGGIGMTIDKDSPLAPLMEILLQLRLGDRERALEAYLSSENSLTSIVLSFLLNSFSLRLNHMLLPVETKTTSEWRTCLRSGSSRTVSPSTFPISKRPAYDYFLPVITTSGSI